MKIQLKIIFKLEPVRYSPFHCQTPEAFGGCQQCHDDGLKKILSVDKKIFHWYGLAIER